MPRGIDGMVVVITGASAGIGKALAIALHSRRAKLVLAARRLDVLDQLKASLSAAHLTVRCDVAEPSDCENLVRRSIEPFGRIDTLVCNAGYGMIRTVAEATPQETEH